MNNSSLHHISPSSLETERFLMRLKMGIWALGIVTWLSGITERCLAVFSDRYLSLAEIVQLLTIVGFFIGWLFLKPVYNVFKWYYPKAQIRK
jgi:hypothetical protein